MNDNTNTSPDAVAYENSDDPIWARKALDLYADHQLKVDLKDDGQGVLSAQVWGPCPRCGHALDVQPTLTAPVPVLRDDGLWAALTGWLPRDKSKFPDTIEVGCGCKDSHPGAPEQVRGCGVSFTLPTNPPPAPNPAPATPKSS